MDFNEQLAEQKSETSSINIKEVFLKYIKYWPLFLLSTAIAFVAVFFYLKTLTPTYRVMSKVLIKDGVTSESVALDVMKINNNTSLNNQIEVLGSQTLMQKVVEDLRLDVSVNKKGKFREFELYGEDIPFELEFVSKTNELGSFILEFKDNTYSIAVGNNVYKANIGQAIRTKFGVIKVSNPKPKFVNGEFIVKINGIGGTAGKLSRELKIDNSKGNNVLNISITLPSVEKGKDVLTQLMKVYDRESIDDKNIIAKNTVNFIEERLRYLVAELSGVEKNVADYKQRYNVVRDINERAVASASKTQEFENKIEDYGIQLNILNSLQSYINSRDEHSIVPTSLGISDGVLNQLISQYNNSQLKRKQLLNTVEPSSILIQEVDKDIKILKSNINESIKNVRRGIEVTRAEILKNNTKYESTVQNAPDVERKLLEIQRQQNIKEGIYSYLLQKKEEASISLAAVAPSSRIIDSGMYKGKVAPDEKNYYLGALLIGLALPALGLFIKEIFNNKVESQNDIKSRVDVPILGEITHSDDKEFGGLVVREFSRDQVSELFRLVRSNLRFTTQKNSNNVILVTSSMTGEGKTFITTNLGASLALIDKKVCVVEFDIRKPRLMQSLDMRVKRGITNFVIDNTLTVDDLITPIEGFKSFYTVAAGPVPPNPAELLLSDRIRELMTELRARFDYVLLDTSPIGQVADAFSLNEYIDASIYVVRYNYTFKEQMNILKDIKTNNKLKNTMVVLNDANIENSTAYGYGYGYGYGYDQSTKVPKTFKEKLLNKFKKK